MNRKEKILGGCLGIAFLIFLAGNHGTGRTDQGDAATPATAAETTPAELTAEQVRAKIADYAIDPITKDQYPKIYKRLGGAMAADAYHGAQAAAYRVARSADCDSIDTASITMDSTRKAQRYFVNCANLKQWHFTAAELKTTDGKWYTADNAPAADVSDTDRRNAEREAARANAPADYVSCETAIKGMLKHPASADFHSMLGRADFVNPNNENVLRVDFEAQNGFGAMMTHTGQCIFAHNGTIKVDIFDR